MIVYRKASANDIVPALKLILRVFMEYEARLRKDEILQAIHALCGAKNPIKRFQGAAL